MILTVVLAGVISILCAAASLRRVAFAVAPTAFDPTMLLASLRGDAGKKRLPRIRRSIELEPSADWERELLAALSADVGSRTGLVNEALSELDHRVKRWSRVPRVCASIATSSAFLLASVTLRAVLTSASDDDLGGSEFVNHAVISAVDVAAIGIAGAAICIASQLRARRAEKEFAEAADKLVARLEAIV